MGRGHHAPRPGSARERSEAEALYRSTWAQVWRAARVADVPDVLEALARFQQAATALSLTRPNQATRGRWGDVLRGWPARADDDELDADFTVALVDGDGTDSQLEEEP